MSGMHHCSLSSDGLSFKFATFILDFDYLFIQLAQELRDMGTSFKIYFMDSIWQIWNIFYILISASCGSQHLLRHLHLFLPNWLEQAISLDIEVVACHSWSVKKLHHSHCVQHVTWIIVVVRRKMQNMPLKKALINEKAAAVRGDVVQVWVTTSVWMCVCAFVYVRASTVCEMKWREIQMSLLLKWERRSKVAKTPVMRLHETHPYWCSIYHHRLPGLTWKVMFNASLKRLEGFKCSEQCTNYEKGLIFNASPASGNS